VIAWDRALETVLLAVSLAAPLALFSNGYDAALVKLLLTQIAAALAAACWTGRAVEAGRFELPAGRSALAAAALLWLCWEPGPAPILFLAGLLGPVTAGFLRRLAGAAALSAGALLLAGLLGKPLMPDPHAFGVFMAAAAALTLGTRREPGEAEAASYLRALIGALAAGACVASGSLAALAALAGAAALLAPAGGRALLLLAALPAALFFTPVSEAQWLLLAPAPRPGALVSLAAAVLCARRGHWAFAASAAACAAAGLVSPYDAGALGWIAAGAGAARAASDSLVRVVPLPYSPLARRYAYLPLAALLAAALWIPARLFVSDARYNEALARAGSDPEGALELLRGVWSGSPLAARAVLAEAGLHRRAGRAEEALRAYARAADLSPGDARISRSIGILESEAGRWESAAGYLAAAVKRDGLDARSWSLLLEARRRLGDKAGALEAARGLVRSSPQEPASWYALAEAYQETKEYSRSRLARGRGARAVSLAKRRR
jgi:tetratricopeptide (TPR) repeat protein